MLIDVAVTAPVLSAGPMAVTQRPTARAVAVAGPVWEKVVVLVVSTVMLTGGRVVVVVGAEVEVVVPVGRRPPKPLRREPSTTKPVEETEVTLPKAIPTAAADPPPAVPPPPGAEPGLAPPAPPPNRPPPAGPPAPPPPEPPAPPRVQFPLESGWIMVTDRAVTGPVVDPGDAGVPVAVTQSPTATAPRATAVVWVKVVDDVQLTVTWLDVEVF
jgi:hypothetical protein